MILLDTVPYSYKCSLAHVGCIALYFSRCMAISSTCIMPTSTSCCKMCYTQIDNKLSLCLVMKHTLLRNYKIMLDGCAYPCLHPWAEPNRGMHTYRNTNKMVVMLVGVANTDITVERACTFFRLLCLNDFGLLTH